MLSGLFVFVFIHLSFIRTPLNFDFRVPRDARYQTTGWAGPFSIRKGSALDPGRIPLNPGGFLSIQLDSLSIQVDWLSIQLDWLSIQLDWLRSTWIELRSTWIELRSNWIGLRSSWIELRSSWIELGPLGLSYDPVWLSLIHLDWVTIQLDWEESRWIELDPDWSYGHETLSTM